MENINTDRASNDQALPNEFVGTAFSLGNGLLTLQTLYPVILQ